jgi:hypothetical protein
MLQARRSLVRFLIMSLDFSVDVILPAALWPENDSASNRNEYQESSWGVKGGLLVTLTASLPSLSRLSRKYDSLDVSQPCGPHRRVAGIVLLVFFFCLLLYKYKCRHAKKCAHIWNGLQSLITVELIELDNALISLMEISRGSGSRKLYNY